MTEQMQQNVVPGGTAVHDDPCPRCGSTGVRVILYGPLDLEVEAVPGFAGVDDAPIFDCRECGFEWGLAVRELLG
ncbi:hypothetical protein [Agromyces larvae]|uniref:Small CPxCG-related zinc finger protein n=1 Tax=Agromyces larvae TaxID=2929802 RepID=A0ABY4BUQ6_9MICO|nr:hypothetical protein [Agromyces larvae]UOE42935.1 hypothetical protein MTO99_12135 [Agromyces larvae]